MPASVSAKIEKHQSSSAAAPTAAPNAVAANAENAAGGGVGPAGPPAVDNSTPIRQALVIIEHKIRNLEKRKAKLESYRDLEKSGKELNSDMKTAVSKYGEVAQTLEFAREFSKQILLIATTSEKEQKKKQKKEESAKKQADISKIREILVMQDILSMLEDETVREDLAKEQNGACKVDESTLVVLDKYYLEVTPRRPESHEETPFKTVTSRAADHLLSTVESKPKSFAGEKETYADIRNVLKEIQKSGYFDKASQPPPPPPPPVVVEERAPEEAVVVEEEPVVAAAVTATEEQQTCEEVVDPVTIEPDFQMAPAADAVPAPSFPPQTVMTAMQNMVVQQMPMLQQQQQLQHPQHIQSQQPPLNGLPGQMVQSIPLGPNMVPVAGVPPTITVKPVPHQQAPNQSIHPAHQAPTTVRAVEQAYFKQHQYISQMRPLAEVVNAQNFFFLQDSELDGPDVMSQTPTVSGFPVQAAQISPNLQQHPANPNIPNQQQQHMQHLQQQQQHQLQNQPHHPASVRTPQQQQPQVPLQQQQQQPQPIPSQPFANQSFPNVISGTPIFPGSLKPGELSQPHIPGFANANAPIPIPLLTQQPGQPQLLPSQQQQQQPQSTTNVLPQQQSSSAVNSVNAQLPTFPSQQQTGTGFLPLQAIVSNNNNNTPLGNNQPPSSSSLATVKINQSNKQQPIPDVETRVPEITEWKPEDAVKTLPDELSNEWQGQYFQSSNVEPEVTDWNDESNAATTTAAAEESNAWPSNGQQRFPYRNQTGYNGGRGNNNRSGAGSRNATTAAAGNAESSTNNNTVNNNTNGGYRNRASYQQANGARGETGGGRQQQAQTTAGSGNGTFYRNNETYYQNGNSGGGGGYRGGDKSGGGYRDNKQQDGGYRGGNNFRSRDTSGNAGGARGGNAGGVSGRSNNRYNSNSAERGQSTGSRSNTNTSAGGRNEPSPVGGGQASRPVATTTKQHTVYGGGPRPSGARQTVNV